MKNYLSLLIVLLFLIMPYKQAKANNPMEKRMSVSGYVKDAKTGEALTGATVYVKEIKNGTMTNLYGFYSLNLLAGSYTLEFKYVGYESITKSINLQNNTVFNIELAEETQMINEVVVKTTKPDDNVKKNEMSVTKLEMKTIRQIPAFMGEVDIIKAIQMLPGVIPTAEGTSGFSVRGGGNDQNLIVLDEATVYNASHLMGFFSVFNNDAIRDIKLYKGDIPAYYGGRLSSVLDVRMKEGNSKKFSATGGLGLISSRLTLEGPIVKEKTSFLVSGRRTYADIFFPLFSDTNLQKSILYFYDLNLKINHQINENNRLFVSGYLGRDIFGQKGLSSAGFGNKTATMRWNHQFSTILFSNITGIVSNYDYSLKMKQGGDEYVWNSNLVDYGLKADFNLYPDPNNEVKFGVSSIYHVLDPINAWIDGDSTTNFPRLKNYELEHAFYVSNQQKIGSKLTIKYGLRYSIFQNLGKVNFKEFGPDHELVRTIQYDEGEIFHTYKGLEPRLGFQYSINDLSSIKASYSRTIQYMLLASNSNGGMPLDYWFASNPNVKPQKSDQYAIGYFRNFMDNSIEFSFETFYKNMTNVIDFKDHAQLLFNSELEGDVRVGKAHSYGAEFMLRKNDGVFNGWISYTRSRAIRKIEDINNGKSYPAPYDKPNNVNIILNYELSKRLRLSANWVYASGSPMTFPVGSFMVGNNAVPLYSNRNSARMRDYHRLDLSITLKGSGKLQKIWQGEWVFSCYNVYGRHNDWMINIVNDPDYAKKNIDPESKIAQRTYLPFVFFPGITYNFNF